MSVSGKFLFYRIRDVVGIRSSWTLQMKTNTCGYLGISSISDCPRGVIQKF